MKDGRGRENVRQGWREGRKEKEQKITVKTMQIVSTVKIMEIVTLT